MHAHVHGAGSPQRVLKISLGVTLAYLVLLVVAGIRAHSLALLSEAGHNLSDFLALLLSLVAVYLQSRPASATKTYGYHRAGVLAALVNAVSLLAVSFFIGALILWSGFGIVRETLNILLEGTPRGVKLELVETAIRSIEGVNDVHDLHVWSIGSETHALSCHIAIADIPPSVSERILRDVKDRLHHHFRIDHTTIQFEHVECEVAHGCVMPVGESEEHHHHSH